MNLLKVNCVLWKLLMLLALKFILDKNACAIEFVD